MNTFRFNLLICLLVYWNFWNFSIKYYQIISNIQIFGFSNIYILDLHNSHLLFWVKSSKSDSLLEVGNRWVLLPAYCRLLQLLLLQVWSMMRQKRQLLFQSNILLDFILHFISRKYSPVIMRKMDKTAFIVSKYFFVLILNCFFKWCIVD